MKRLVAFILCLMMLMSSFVFVNAEEVTEVTEANDDQIVVAYFNASAYPGKNDFTNIDVLNYHPAHIETSALGYVNGDTIITHNYTAQLDSWKEKAYAQNPDIKFVFTVANGNLQVFESWFTSPERVRRLVKEMLSIVETYGFDGLDIDYEFPQGGNNPKKYFVQFMKLMREGFDALSAENGKEYILSMAVPATSWAFSLFNMTELAQYVSYFNIMSYDLHVGSATKGITHHHTNPCADPNFVGGSVEEDIALYREMGIPDDKIVVGIGMYARRWTGVEAGDTNGLYQAGTLDETSNQAYLHYSVLRASYENKNGYVKYWDDVAKAPYLYNASKKEFYTYDDEQSAKIKCELAVSEGVRGVMVFDYVTTDNFGFFDNLQTWLDEAHRHSYSPTVEKEATCTEEGIMRYLCECGDYYDEAIPATGEHDFGEWVVDVEPTYELMGVKKSQCSNCDYIRYEDIPVKEYVNPFTDVKDSYWFADAVEYCVKKGYVTGMTETTFAPNDNLTRAQFLTMLAALDGADLSVYEGKDSGFTDVKPAHWWNKVICWAVENEYTSGISADKFGPNNYITREQLARFFYVYTEKNGLDVSARADLSAYEDAGKIGPWARENMEWAVEVGIISGTSATALSPRGNATRAQAARMMMVYDGLNLETVII